MFVPLPDSVFLLVVVIVLLVKNSVFMFTLWMAVG